MQLLCGSTCVRCIATTRCCAQTSAHRATAWLRAAFNKQPPALRTECIQFPKSFLGSCPSSRGTTSLKGEASTGQGAGEALLAEGRVLYEHFQRPPGDASDAPKPFSTSGATLHSQTAQYSSGSVTALLFYCCMRQDFAVDHSLTTICHKVSKACKLWSVVDANTAAVSEAVGRLDAV
jgi:hypothetical protein